MLKPLPRPRRARRQRGLSIVELLVGLAVGLFVVAGAALVVGGQLSSNRTLLLDTQLQQDLRAAAEFVGRELRRAGSMSDGQSIDRIWVPTYSTPPKLNLYANALSPNSGETTSINYEYYRGAGSTAFGFDLSGGKIRSKIEGSYQDLTDSNVMVVDVFTITLANTSTLTLPCATECVGGGTACWPTIVVRDAIIDIQAHAKNDTAVTRSIRTTVKLRNDFVRRGPGITSGFCPAA